MKTARLGFVWLPLHQWPFKHLLVDFDVGISGVAMVEISLRLAHDALYLPVFQVFVLLVEFHCFIYGPEQPLCIVIFEDKTVAAVMPGVNMRDGVMQSASIMYYGQRSVDRSYHLRQPTWFEARGHENEVSSCIAQSGEIVIEVHDCDMILQAVVICYALEHGLIFAIGHESKLRLLWPEAVYDFIEYVRE